MHLLLAEDDKISRDLLRRIIESDAHTVTLAEDGEEAWKLLTDTPDAFDACVFDICMPTISGIELIERMRGREDLKRMPVILCSAVSDRSTVQQAAALGVHHYVVKPYSRAVMNEKLRAIRAAGGAAENTAGLMEPSEIVCRRLGLEMDVYREMVQTMVEDAADWGWDVRASVGRQEVERIFIRGRGLKGSCLSIGLRGAAQKIEVIEQMLQGFLQSTSLELPREPVDGAMGELDREVQAVRIKLKLPRPTPRRKTPAEAGAAPDAGAVASPA